MLFFNAAIVRFYAMVLLVVVAAWGSVSCAGAESATAVAKRSVLVDVQWLAKHINDPRVRLIELGPTREEFAAGHLPKAQFLDWIDEITDPEKPERYTKVGKQRMGELLSALGVSNGSTVVFSDTADSRLSVRMLWMLRYYGHQDVRVLDGGRNAWLRSGRRLTREAVKPVPTRYVVRAELKQLCTERSFVEEKIGDDWAVLIDGRPNDQFTGKAPGKVYHTGTEHARRGHIPGAVNVPWQANLKPDGTFKSREALMQLYVDAGVNTRKLAITYCNEGLHAAMPWFVLTELLGHPDARLYDDSMAEWANTDETPVVVTRQQL